MRDRAELAERFHAAILQGGGPLVHEPLLAASLALRHADALREEAGPPAVPPAKDAPPGLLPAVENLRRAAAVVLQLADPGVASGLLDALRGLHAAVQRVEEASGASPAPSSGAG